MERELEKWLHHPRRGGAVGLGGVRHPSIQTQRKRVEGASGGDGSILVVVMLLNELSYRQDKRMD